MCSAIRGLVALRAAWIVREDNILEHKAVLRIKHSNPPSPMSCISFFSVTRSSKLSWSRTAELCRTPLHVQMRQSRAVSSAVRHFMVKVVFAASAMESGWALELATAPTATFGSSQRRQTLRCQSAPSDCFLTWALHTSLLACQVCAP